MDISRRALKTSKGSLLNATEICLDGRSMLFSYETMVAAIWEGTCYYQREGLAGSRTTMRHINLYANGRNKIELTKDNLNNLVSGRSWMIWEN